MLGIGYDLGREELGVWTDSEVLDAWFDSLGGSSVTKGKLTKEDIDTILRNNYENSYFKHYMSFEEYIPKGLLYLELRDHITSEINYLHNYSSNLSDRIDEYNKTVLEEIKRI